jgi:hypothetical protein
MFANKNYRPQVRVPIMNFLYEAALASKCLVKLFEYGEENVEGRESGRRRS